MDEELLIPNDEYLKSGIHIGTKFKTKYMENFIYKTRPDGLSVLNVQQIDARIKVLISFMSNYAPEEIMVAARRENGWKPANLFGESLLEGCPWSLSMITTVPLSKDGGNYNRR